MLIPSSKPSRLVFTSAFGFLPGGPLPVLSVAKEDTLLLRRLLPAGAVTVALEVDNTVDRRPSKEVNVVADLPGRSDDILLLGAHFDSWDAAQGAHDNAGGVAAVLDVARMLKELRLVPRHTIRFVLFSGEEQGLLGSHAYVVRHEAELDRHRLVIVNDSGVETPRGFELYGRDDLRSPIERCLGTLTPLGASGLGTYIGFDSDHGPFLEQGVPAMTLWVDEGHYETYHHTSLDTYDKVDPQRLAADAAVLAMALVALDRDLDGTVRRLSPAEAERLLERTGMKTTRDMLRAGR